METLECMRTRRSRRKYLNKPVSDDVINTLIDAARNAPFGGPPILPCQIWRFMVIRNAETKKKLALTYKDRQYIATAPVIIAVCVSVSADAEYKEHDVVGALAIENIILAAHSLGLGTCFVDCFPQHDGHKEDKALIRKVLQVPDNVKVLGLLPIGYPDPSEKIEEKALCSVKELIHKEKW